MNPCEVSAVIISQLIKRVESSNNNYAHLTAYHGVLRDVNQ